MEVAREAVELGRSARAQAKIKVRQPLAEAVIVAGPDEREAIERFRALVLDELNVREVRFVSDADELGRWELKPNYRALGPRFGKHMPQVAAAVAAPGPRARARAAGRWGSRSTAASTPWSPTTCQMALQPLDGYQLERAGTHAVALNLELDDDLRREGLAREIVHAVQAARKDAGLKVEDRITLTLGGDPDLVDAARAHEGYVSGETLATSLDLRRHRRRRERDHRRPRAADSGRPRLAGRLGARARAPSACAPGMRPPV